jgi:hypothetical protein
MAVARLSRTDRHWLSALPRVRPKPLCPDPTIEGKMMPQGCRTLEEALARRPLDSVGTWTWTLDAQPVGCVNPISHQGLRPGRVAASFSDLGILALRTCGPIVESANDAAGRRSRY